MTHRADDMADIGVVVLAAGAATRFGGGKLLADLEGRPLLAHVIGTVRAVRPARTVVVLGADAERVREAIGWVDEVLVTNPRPEAGLAGSLRMAVAACLQGLPAPRGVLVVLGDQPRTSSVVIRALVRAIPDAMSSGAWAVVPRYAGGGGGNPALLLPTGLARVPDLRGDRGLGSLLEAVPGRAFRVSVEGSNPDVDTLADLRALDGDRPTTPGER